MRELPVLRIGDALDAAGGGTDVPVEEDDAREAVRTAAADLDPAQRHPGRREVRDVGALAVAGMAAQRPVGAPEWTMVDRHEVREAPRLVVAHARVGLVDRVPAEPLLDAADRREAVACVEL